MSDELPVYTVTVSREDNLWVAVVDGLPGGATDVEHFDDLRDAVYDLIATLTDTETGEFWVEWKFLHGSYRLFELLQDFRQWERQAEVAITSRDAARWALADAMRDSGLSYREIADVIGMSHQRVSQILEKEDRDVGVDFRIGDQIYQVKHWPPAHVLTQALKRWSFTPSPDELSYPRPLEGAIVMLLHAALQASPAARHDLLTTTAAMLEEAAEDNDFIRQTGVVQSSPKEL